MKGVYQHCSEKHLHRYLAEFDFRYSNRAELGIDDVFRSNRALVGAKGRLMYRDFTDGIRLRKRNSTAVTPARKREVASHRFPARGGVGFRLKIDAFTPATIPMARLSEYMTALAELLGEPEHVHFNRLTPGSLNVNLRVDWEAAPKVRARADAVREGTALTDAMNAYRTINKMLREDNGTGGFKQDKERGKIFVFPWPRRGAGQTADNQTKRDDRRPTNSRRGGGQNRSPNLTAGGQAPERLCND